MAVDPFGGAIGAGLQELAGGGDFDDVVGAVVQTGVLSFLPLFAVGQAVGAAVEQIKVWTGNTKRVPVLGILLTVGETKGPTELAAETLVYNAAVQAWKGYATFHGSGPGVALHPGHPEDAWLWAQQMADLLAKRVEEGGTDAVLHELQTSALTAQALDAARALYEWARATQGKPLVPITILKPLNGPLFKATGIYSQDPALLASDFPPDRPPIKGKWHLFKRLGLPSYQEYAAEIAARMPPSAAPLLEVFPGAQLLGLEDGVPAQGLEDGGADATQHLVSSSQVGVPSKQKQKRELLLVGLVGAGALLLALL